MFNDSGKDYIFPEERWILEILEIVSQPNRPPILMDVLEKVSSFIAGLPGVMRDSQKFRQPAEPDRRRVPRWATQTDLQQTIHSVSDKDKNVFKDPKDVNKVVDRSHSRSPVRAEEREHLPHSRANRGKEAVSRILWT